jgi:hypothetical protein
MKKIICTIVVFAFLANVTAQLKVDSLGNTHIYKNVYLEGDSNIIAATQEIPITFKVGGFLAGNTGIQGSANVSFGHRALNSNTTGVGNTAIGVYTLRANTTGSENTAVGPSALLSNTTGYNNIALGNDALYLNTTGYDNVANGSYAIHHNTTGSNNTANGVWALYYNTTGSYNTAHGLGALFSNTTGNYNTSIGYHANFNASGTNNNTIAIGYEASTTSSNQARIGNSSVTSIGGYAAWSNFSDKRAKKNIRTDVPGLAFINQLQPVTYNLDLDAIDGLLKIDRTKKPGKDGREHPAPQELTDIEKQARAAKEKQVQTGFIAQDVEKTAQSIGYDFSGVDVDETGIYGLRYAEFTVPLVKAVQELSAQNEQLQAQVSELTAQVAALLGKDAGAGKVGSEASLQQNTPNPFTQSTVIGYTLPQGCKSAQIVIANASGNTVRQILLSPSGGTDSTTIESGTLPAGIYHYSLYVDGSLVDTKQMILTK